MSRYSRHNPEEPTRHDWTAGGRKPEAQGSFAAPSGSARWSVSLDCDCPKCGKHVNLLDAPDFWDGRTLNIPEHGTENSDNLEVRCPECDHEFNVCCEW
jgi:phage FluMu protein Com